MCGINGIIGNKGVPKGELKEGILRMNALLSHRGPDHQDIYVSDKVGLGHTRLSILDLTDAGHQPMKTPDERYAIVLNGEIYNHLEIRQTLEELGYHFRGHSDTETVLYGFAQWGEAIFQKLNGIFAVGIYDQQKKEVYLARDRFGVKPLYYFKDQSKLIFSSEIKSILASGVYPKLSYKSLHEFLYYGYPLGDRTMLEGIKKVLPGYYLKISQPFHTKKCCFWKPENLLELSPFADSEEEAIKKTRALLEKAVRRQLMSDVPVGVFLSGGIDSSAITAFASRHFPGKLKTYSTGFDFDEGHNELPLAAEIAKTFGTEHHEMMIRGADLPDIIEKLVGQHDAPFSDAANIPLYLMTRALGGDPKVILQGDGGDELFGGYSRYHLMTKYRPYRTILNILKPLKGILPSAKLRARVERFYPVFSEREDGRMFAKLLTLETEEKSPLQTLSIPFHEKAKSHDPFEYYTEVATRFNGLSDRIQKLLWLDTQIILPDQFLEKVDKSTMANSIEVRVPFLDNELAEYAMRMPAKYKLKGGIKKYILKKALEGIVPDKVLYGPKKGFGVPYENWLKGPLSGYLKERLFSSDFAKSGMMDKRYVKSLLSNHLSSKQNNGFILWKLLNLSIWLEKYKVEI